MLVNININSSTFLLIFIKNHIFPYLSSLFPFFPVSSPIGRIE